MHDVRDIRSPERLSGEPFWVRRPVPAALRGLVTGMMGYRENGRGLRGEVETASLIAPLIISFGGPFSIALSRPPTTKDHWSSFAAGLHAGPVMMDSSGDASCVQVNFTPGGARRFFGLPMSELAARMVTLDDLGDRALLALRQRLSEEDDWDHRLALVEQFVIARLQNSAAADDATTDWAFREMRRSGGEIRISRLARTLGCSRKHLAACFAREFGLAPKSIARMVRFQNVLAQARHATPVWAGIAAASGYADQAHLAREFLEFSGMTPTQWAARQQPR
jgi:AraC-like DNA-binding protein